MNVRDIAIAFLAKEPEDWTWVDPEQIKALAEFVKEQTERSVTSCYTQHPNFSTLTYSNGDREVVRYRYDQRDEVERRPWPDNEPYPFNVG